MGTKVTSPSLLVLDVGHGSCVVLESDEELTLIDTGAGATVLEHLRAIDRTTIDLVLLSHADQDHVGALVNLLADELFSVHKVWLNSDAFKGSALWESLAYELDAQDRTAKTRVELGIREGQSFESGPFRVEIMAPRLRLVELGAGNSDREGRRLESNSLSIVCRISVGQQPLALVPGDLDETGLSHLLDKSPPPDLTAPILVFPHHGGHVSRASNASRNAEFAAQFVELVKPSTIVFSIGRGQHGTPRAEIVSAIRSVAPDVNILCTELSRLCAADLLGAKDSVHLLKAVARGRNLGACCAGTIIIDQGQDGWRVRPDRQMHQAFISTNALTSLCRTGPAL